MTAWIINISFCLSVCENPNKRIFISVRYKQYEKFAKVYFLFMGHMNNNMLSN